MEKGFGYVRAWKEDRGFGFIKMDNGGDIFFHIRDISDTEDILIPTYGMDVTFDIEEGREGRLKATNVKFVSK